VRVLTFVLSQVIRLGFTPGTLFFQKKTGPGRMAETPHAGTGDSACRSWRYRCSTMLNWQGSFSMTGTFLIRLSLLEIIVDSDNSSNIHNTGFFPDCQLLSVTDGSICIPYLARYSEIFKEPNFQVVKWKSTFIWNFEIPLQSESETERSRGLPKVYILWFGSHPTGESDVCDSGDHYPPSPVIK